MKTDASTTVKESEKTNTPKAGAFKEFKKRNLRPYSPHNEERRHPFCAGSSRQWAAQTGLALHHGVNTTRDFANRSNIIRIRKQSSGYQFQKFEEGDLLNPVRRHQAYYMGCVFAVIRAWHAEGRPRMTEPKHDFREWAEIVDWIVQNIFQTVPVMEGHRQAQERVCNPALVWLRSVMLTADRRTRRAAPTVRPQSEA